MAAPLLILERDTTIVVRGNARTVLADGGFRGVYNGVARGWVLDRHRLPDLLAYLDARRIGYRVTAAGEAA